MMKMYLQNISSLNDPKEDTSMLSGIPEWRQKKILSYAHPGDRKRCYGAWRLLEGALVSRGVAAHRVIEGANGTLVCPGVNFNLSHSEDMALCVISDSLVGCDIEKIRKAPWKAADRYFSEKEQEYLADATTDDEVNRRFFELWTMKESYLKMTGEGMSCSPRRIEIDWNRKVVLRDAQPQKCQIQSFIKESYQIAVCIHD